MKIQISHVDLSALPDWRRRVKAVSALCRATDPHHDLGMQIGASLAPPGITVTKIAPSLLQLTRVVE